MLDPQAQCTIENSVADILEQITTSGTAPTSEDRSGIAAAAHRSLELLVEATRDDAMPLCIPPLENAAARWATSGLPLDSVLHALHRRVRLAADASAMTVENNARGSFHEERGTGQAARIAGLIDALDLLTSAITKAYAHKSTGPRPSSPDATETVATALLRGESPIDVARECGIRLVSRYAVLAIHMPPHSEELAERIDPHPAHRGRTRRVRSELKASTGADALALLSHIGGTILLPAQDVCDRSLERLTARLSHAARAPITATVDFADLATVPETVKHVHHLLESITGLGYPAGLYRLRDMALVAQLTAPGPGRESLASILDPLEDHPELMTFLQAHLHNNLNRRRTGRQFGIHTGTVDYRLRRIGQIIGRNPTSADSVWLIQSAFIARGRPPIGATRRDFAQEADGIPNKCSTAFSIVLHSSASE
ncbi:PucR family transcriptional regulator [Nocardia macrotermitis]|uniref:PucR C-terminal helix-turn-helix domain-containing protein n=1 Tax=Nocardia macrotermitis TaxID=2585198 RepID=A0A7K0D5C9_9NOCA|nr:helix-turn-helix domain-containing protein [Nocardia macrotermitis]MQY20955.1 hypothetical protein [Nocardia macrotermitis]